MTQKFDKSVRKMRLALKEIEESRSVQMERKVVEKRDLELAGQDIRQKSRHIIADIRKNVDERVRVMAWKSHARQIKVGETVAQLKKGLNQSTNEHIESETELRHANNALENEIDEMISTYDREMFRRHRDIERISEEYANEKEELEMALASL